MWSCTPGAPDGRLAAGDCAWVSIDPVKRAAAASAPAVPRNLRRVYVMAAYVIRVRGRRSAQLQLRVDVARS
jgi:hypothetical protein